MAVLFDSRGLVGTEADEALTALFTDAGLPIKVSHVHPGASAPTTVEHWPLGRQNLFIARGAALRLVRARTELRVCAPEGVRLGYQLTGSYRLTVGEHQEANNAGQLNIIDLTQPCDFAQYGFGAATGSLELSWDDLELNAETIRRSAPILQRSPVYALMQAHMARLCADPNMLRSPDVEFDIGQATMHLARAFIATADDESTPRARAILDEALHARIVEYILLHLTERSLDPERIAAAHNVSLRQLYRLWAHNAVTIAEWIIAQRLALAATELTNVREPKKSISVIAYSLGFADAAHFSRRFRAAYGMPPRMWRQELLSAVKPPLG